MEAAYTYRATVLRVIDADTFVTRVDLGFRVSIELPLRLAGVDSPEMSTPEGRQARAFLAAYLAPLPFPVVTRTKKPLSSSLDNFGRYLADVFIGNLDLAAYLVANGQAKAWTP